MDGKTLGDMPVNPQQEATWDQDEQRYTGGTEVPGITLRQHYAGLAMQGLLANTDQNDEKLHVAGKFAPIMAENAVLFADALLAALTEEAK